MLSDKLSLTREIRWLFFLRRQRLMFDLAIRCFSKNFILLPFGSFSYSNTFEFFFIQFFQHYFKNCTVESEILKGTFCSFHRRDRHILVSPRKDPPLSKEFVTKIPLSTEFSWCPQRPDLVARPLAGPAGRLRGSIGWGGAGTNRKRGIGFGGRVRAAFGRLGQKCFTCFARSLFPIVVSSKSFPQRFGHFNLLGGGRKNIYRLL